MKKVLSILGIIVLASCRQYPYSYCKKLLIFIFLFFGFSLMQAQSVIKGKVTDKTKIGLTGITVRLLRPDSTFVGGTATDSIGNFSMKNIQTGKYLLVVSSIGYTPKWAPIHIQDKEQVLTPIVLDTDNVLLKEVVVEGQSFIRQEDKVLIIPEKQQVRHSHTGYDLLYNLMIPNIDVDRHDGKVKTFGGEVSLYIDGRKVDYREIQSLRPRDVEKIEYYDAPTGKYANDVASINYIMKKYKSGGYVSLDGKQMIGYLNGDYNASAKISHGNTSYTVWAGSQMQKYDGTQSVNDETYLFPDYEIQKRSETTDGKSKSNKQYIQANIENQTQKRTLVGKVGFTRSAIPEQYQTLRTVYSGNYSHEDETYNARHETGIMPSLNLYGSFKIKDNQQLVVSADGSYSTTEYERTYRESAFKSLTNVTEDY